MQKLALAFAFILLLATNVHATVDNEIARNSYVGNGTTTNYPYTFRILANDQIEVFVNSVRFTLNIQYIVTGVNDQTGGSIIFTTAPPAGVSIAFTRFVPFTQLTDYIPNQAISANTLETNFDRIVMALQEIRERQQRTPALPPGIPLFDLAFPQPGASLCIRWNTAGTALETIACGTGGSSTSGITSLNGAIGAIQIFGNDSNVAIVTSVNTHQVTWAGLLPISRGGTNAATAADARIALGIGTVATSDIPVPVASGGTGQTTLNFNSILIGAGTAGIFSLPIGPSNTVLMGSGGVPTFQANPQVQSLTTTLGIQATGGVSTGAQAALTVMPYAGTAGATGEIRLQELAVNGSMYVGIKAPDLISANKIWTWPAADGSAGHVLTTNGAGILTFAAPSGGGTGITSLEGQTGAVQTFTDDTNVKIVSAADTHVITWAGLLGVARGGTGATSLTANGVLLGNGTSAVTATAVGAAGQVLYGVNSGAPIWSTTPFLTTLNTIGQIAIAVQAYGTGVGQTGEIRFYELSANGPSWRGFKAPDALNVPSFVWTLPAADGTAGQVLSTNGAGILSFISPAAGFLSGSGVASQVPFFSTSSALAGDAAFLWNNTTKSLSVTTGTYFSDWGVDVRPAELQITSGSIGTPRASNKPIIFASLIASPSGGLDPVDQPATIKAFMRQQTISTAAATYAIQGFIDSIAAGATVGNAGVGATAVYGRATSRNINQAVFGMWAHAFDNGNAGSSANGIEVNTELTAPARPFALSRGINIVNSPASTNVQNDIGLFIDNYGYGIVLGTPDSATTPTTAFFIRNQAVSNINTTILAFEAPQPTQYKRGLDFSNAGFIDGAIVFADNGALRWNPGVDGALMGAVGTAAAATFVFTSASGKPAHLLLKDNSTVNGDKVLTVDSGTFKILGHGGTPLLFMLTNGGQMLIPLTPTTGAASKKVLCIDTTNGAVYASTTGTDCSG